jgi:hypothetical protein
MTATTAATYAISPVVAGRRRIDPLARVRRRPAPGPLVSLPTLAPRTSKLRADSGSVVEGPQRRSHTRKGLTPASKQNGVTS